MNSKVSIKNRKASFEYEFIQKYTAGIILVGTEIKSIRANKASISDAYCVIIDSEVIIKNLHISEYKYASFSNHEPKRERKLLLNKQEINKIKSRVQEKGFALVPIRLFINDKGIAKLEIAVAKGKKIYDKRESIKEKDIKRNIEREKII
ncbi:MAG: SsrA-binding protein [Flavobacteriales bacterium]|nr:SsrA-binding protein [Flavobacteriales bacterium]MBH70320.1 SsrA-binding protein [Flavobacteriales bacterium]MBO98009.1 SsrA-binding protein [Flavobacteriales bacterium]|tara:strand:+ start:6115 stop:6564 length:450 start_codon:yes stop_codon:yes gene_type:complete